MEFEVVSAIKNIGLTMIEVASKGDFEGALSL